MDGSPTTAFTVLECEGSIRLGSRPRRYLLTGQANGSLAMWDLTTAMDGLGQTPGTPYPTSTLPMVSLPRSQPSGPLEPFLPSSPFLALFLYFLSESLTPAHPFLCSFPLSYLQLLLVFVLHLTPDPASLPPPAGGLTEEELMGQLEQCELTPLAASRGAFPSPSPRTSLTR